MNIFEKLKQARLQANLTQEVVAEKIHVSRQTISNWENGRSYPDIISVIELSNVYNISLDELLKGDAKMIAHLDKSTNIVKSNMKLAIAIGINVIIFIVFIIFNSAIANNKYLMIVSMIFGVISMTILFYQVIRKF